jgi:hypothetical protein
LHEDAVAQYPEGFVHFAVAIVPNGIADEHKSLSRPPYDWMMPLDCPFLENPLGEIARLPVRVHRIKLSAEVEIQIFGMWLPGRLSLPIVFSFGTGKNHN